MVKKSEYFQDFLIELELGTMQCRVHRNIQLNFLNLNLSINKDINASSREGNH